MKVFIWNTEYQVYVALAEKVEAARAILIDEFIKCKKEWLIDKKDVVPGQQSVPTYVWGRAETILHNDVRDLFQALFKDPDLVLENYQSAIYSHANE